MKCPACSRELVELRLGGLTVDVCRGGCGGIWFDAFELQQVDDKHEVEGNPLFHLERDPDVVVDPARKRECPRCPGIKLKRQLFSPRIKVPVDHCPNCAGYWLDAGELAQIQAGKSLAGGPANPPSGNISRDFIRYLYRLRTESGSEDV